MRDHEADGPDAAMTPATAPGSSAVAVTATDLVLVLIGGAVGTTVRALLSLAIPNAGAFPASTFIINVSGALLMGLLLGLLASDAESTVRRSLRLALGTGFLGGYTTYGMFAVGTDGLIATDRFIVSIGYSLPTVVLGVLAALAGGAVAGLLRRLAADRGGRR